MDTISRLRTNRAWWLLVLVCAALGLVGRLWNIDFDQRQHLHPDERHWAQTSDAIDHAPGPQAHGTVIGPVLDWLDGQRSPANAYRGTNSFVYGPISLATARATARWLEDGVVHDDQPASAVAHALDAIGIPLIDDDGTPRFDNGYNVELIGRLLGALLDTCTIVVVGLIGRRLAGNLVGLTAAGLYATSVLAIQHAHFLGAEPLLGLCCALTMLCTLRLDRSASVRRALVTGAVAGIACGAAVAAKLSAVGVAALPFVGCALLLCRYRRRSDLVRLAALAIGAVVAFRVLDPGAFDGLGVHFSQPFLDDVKVARELVDIDTPPAYQWASRIPVIQPLIWLGVFTIGPAISLAAIAGAVTLVMRRRLGLVHDNGRWPVYVVTGAVVVPFLYMIATAVPTGRYFIPMLPAVNVLAGVGVVAAVRWAVRSRGSRRVAGMAIAATAVALAVVWGAAFVNGVYGRTNTRIEASRWIAAHVEPGSVLTSEAWDDGLPLRLPGVDADAYRYEQFELIGVDDPAKVDHLADQLSLVDYVVESSPRIWNTAVRIPNRFPSTINFFAGLDTGALGFERVATFVHGPQLGFWKLDESSAEEAFSVYDHPEVRIWKKVRNVPRADVVEVLDPVAASNAFVIAAQDAHANGLMLHDDEVAANAHGPTYAGAFDEDGSPVLHAIGWFVLLELFGLAAFAILFPLLSRLPDAGIGMAKILALVTMSFVLFLATSWLDLVLNIWLVAFCALSLSVAGALLGWRRRRALAALWHTRRHVLVAAEIVSAVAFIAFVVVRAMNPDLWHPDRGGEKPFELAFLTAVLRTKTLPPYDPWLSHGAMNYYYGGWLLLSGPARLLRTTPSLALNLGLGLFASCITGAGFTVGAGAVNATRSGWRRGSPSQRRTVVAGVLAGVFVLALSNMAILQSTWQHVTGRTPGAFDWWSLSRVIPNSVAITEFPAWSMLYGELHPHVMSIALLLALVGLGLGLYHSLVDRRRGPSIAVAALIGTLIGFVRATNTWDVPIAVVIAMIAIGAAIASGAHWRLALIATGVVAFVVEVLWAPYAWRGQVFDAGVDRAVLHTPVTSWLEQFGFFAAVSFFAFVVAVVARAQSSPVVWRGIRRAHVALLGYGFIGLGVALLQHDRLVFVICLGLAGSLTWLAWTCSRRPLSSRGAAGPLLLALGWAVQGAVELYTVRNDGGRMNTVFKFWYQSWVVLAVGSAVVIAERLRLPSRLRLRRSRFAAAEPVCAVLLVAFAVLASGTFWWLATPIRMNDRVSSGGLSLDGEAFLTADFSVGAAEDQFVPADDVPLIEWLRHNVHGIHVVSEAPGIEYRWTSQISSLTGLPTPIGWPYHETQQRRRYSATIEARVADMNELYQTADARAITRILSRYAVEYVFYGTQERLLSPDDTAQALRHYDCLDVKTQFGELFVAEVDQVCVNRLRLNE